jgi:hypothetical protein
MAAATGLLSAGTDALACRSASSIAHSNIPQSRTLPAGSRLMTNAALTATHLMLKAAQRARDD